MILDVVRHWRLLSYADWNLECERKGMPYAVLTPPEPRERLRRAWKFGWMDFRERIALRIAPWLVDE